MRRVWSHGNNYRDECINTFYIRMLSVSIHSGFLSSNHAFSLALVGKKKIYSLSTVFSGTYRTCFSPGYIPLLCKIVENALYIDQPERLQVFAWNVYVQTPIFFRGLEEIIGDISEQQEGQLTKILIRLHRGYFSNRVTIICKHNISVIWAAVARRITMLGYPLFDKLSLCLNKFYETLYDFCYDG